jgi:hypothetical protein
MFWHGIERKRNSQIRSKSGQGRPPSTSHQGSGWDGSAGESGGGYPLGKPGNEVLVFQLDPYRAGRGKRGKAEGGRGESGREAEGNQKKNGIKEGAYLALPMTSAQSIREATE